VRTSKLTVRVQFERRRTGQRPSSESHPPITFDGDYVTNRVRGVSGDALGDDDMEERVVRTATLHQVRNDLIPW